MSLPLALGTVGTVGVGIALALIVMRSPAARSRLTARRHAGDGDEVEVTPSRGPVYGVRHTAGTDFAPQPVFGLRTVGPSAPSEPAESPYQPHRPVVTSGTVAAARPRTARAGAHRRESDAAEIARLDALRQSGLLSEDEFASLKGRIG